MQYAVDPWAFARPPPPLAFLGVGSRARPTAAAVPARRPPPPAFLDVDGPCARPAANVPARRRRPPPPGFLGACCPSPRGVPPPAPCELPVPVPPKLPKRAAAPGPHVAAASAKRQRLCPDYEDDIDSNLRLTERNPEERPLPDYLNKVQQDRVSQSARASLVGWMDEFVRHHDLADGTLHRAVAYVDRVLSVRALASPSGTGYELRLLGAAAVFAAAKYEDRCAVFKLDAGKIAKYGWFGTSKEVLDMERHMVAALGYQLGGPTAHTFLAHFMRYAQEEEEDARILSMANLLVDQCLRNYSCLEFLPSVVAASAIFVARFVLNPPTAVAWNMELQELTGYNSLELTGCVFNMHSFSRSLLVAEL